MTRVNVLISGGTVVDGSGAPGRAADVAIEADRLRILERGHGLEAERVIDATNKVVAPGFIDLHSHSGLMILAEPRHEPKVRQGVTTEIIGVDGLSYAPLPSRNDLEALIEMNAGLDGRPDGVAADWASVGEYLARMDGHVAVNVGLMVGNSALRISRLGWDNVPADGAALGDMRDSLVRGACFRYDLSLLCSENSAGHLTEAQARTAEERQRSRLHGRRPAGLAGGTAGGGGHVTSG